MPTLKWTNPIPEHSHGGVWTATLADGRKIGIRKEVHSQPRSRWTRYFLCLPYSGWEIPYRTLAEAFAAAALKGYPSSD